MAPVTHDGRLTGLLTEQIDFLRTSCERFDSGATHEAKRIALSLRVLLHDTKQGSVSLLQQLGLKGKMKLLDTRVRKPSDSTPGSLTLQLMGWPMGMVGMSFGTGTPNYFPMLGQDEALPDAWSPFPEWWKSDLVISTGGQTFSRSHFVVGAANKEGGAHVDPRPSKWWKDLRDGSFKGAGKAVDALGRQAPVVDLAPAVLRQVGFELLESLRSLPLGTADRIADQNPPSGPSVQLSAVEIHGSYTPADPDTDD